MESELTKIEYRWESTFCAQVIGALFRFSITIMIFKFPVLRLTGFIQVLCIVFFLFFFFQFIKDCYHLYLRATKAPVLFQLYKDTLLLRYAFGRTIVVTYSEILQITLDPSLEYFSWNAFIETASGLEIFLNTRTLENSWTLIENIRTNNHQCQIDKALFLQSLPNQELLLQLCHSGGEFGIRRN